MGTLLKLITILLFMNIFLYIGINMLKSNDGYYMNSELTFHWKGDLIDKLMYGETNMKSLADSTRTNWTDYDVNFTGALTTEAQKTGGQSTGEGGISFLDALDIAWAIIPTLFNIAVSPLTIFFNFRLPVLFGLMLGIPYFIMAVITIFMFIRGSGD